MGERWDAFEARLRREGLIDELEVKADEFRRVCKKFGRRGRSNAGPKKLAAVEMGWACDDAKDVLAEIAELNALDRGDLEGVKRLEKKEVMKVERESPWVRCRQEAKADSVVELQEDKALVEPEVDWSSYAVEDEGNGMPRWLVELARLVGNRTAGYAECARWVMSKMGLPPKFIDPKTVPGAECIPMLEMCQSAGGRAKLVQMVLSKAMSQDQAEWDRIRADMGRDVRDQLLSFCGPRFRSRAESGVVLAEE